MEEYLEVLSKNQLTILVFLIVIQMQQSFEKRLLNKDKKSNETSNVYMEGSES